LFVCAILSAEIKIHNQSVEQSFSRLKQKKKLFLHAATPKINKFKAKTKLKENLTTKTTREREKNE
jgi:hypothetical protein